MNVKEFCETHGELVETRAKIWASRCAASARHSDQLISEGYLKLVELANDPRVQEKPTPYISRSIDLAFCRYLRANSDPLTVPRNMPIQPITTCQLNDDACCDSSIDELENYDHLLNGLCKTEEEREVMTLRHAMYTDVEIAEQLNMSQQKVSRIRARIGERY